METKPRARTFEQAEALLQKWNLQNPLYEVRSCDLYWNFHKQTLVSYEVHTFAGVDALICFPTRMGVSAGLNEHQVNVSLWSDVDSKNASQFLSELESFCLNRNFKKWVFGAEDFHFLPGIPIEQKALIESVQKNNYVTMELADLLGSLDQPEVKTLISSISTADFEFEEIKNQNEKLKAIDFLKTEFPGRWLREFLIWDQRVDSNRALWFSLKKNRKIVGFARIGIRNLLLPMDSGWTMGALRLPNGTSDKYSETDGCLGPIGIAKSERGHGTGKILLGLALKELKSRNAKQICIDWTDAFKYYQELNFRRARNYWGAWKQP